MDDGVTMQRADDSPEASLVAAGAAAGAASGAASGADTPDGAASGLELAPSVRKWDHVESGEDQGGPASPSSGGSVIVGGDGKLTLPSSKKTSRGWVVGKAKSDPYVVCATLPPALKAARVPIRTKHIYQTLNPTWDEALVLSLKAADFLSLKK